MAGSVGEIDVIEANALRSNPASRRVLEKCGFGPAGETLVAAPERGGALRAERYVYAMRATAGLEPARRACA